MLESSTIQVAPAPGGAWQFAASAASHVERLVRRLDPLEDPDWDSALAVCPDASFFQSASWARVLNDAYGFKPSYFAIRDSDRLHALLPFMEVDSWLTGRRGVSLPFTDECSPICADADSFRNLHQAAMDHAKRRGWKYLEFRGGRPLFGTAPASESFVGHRLDLAGGEAALHARLTKAARGSIKKAEQNGLTIEFSRDPRAVRDFHGLLCKTRKRLGVPPQPLHFFSAIQRHILARELGWVVLARLGQMPVAGAVYFHFGKTVVYKYSASDEAYRHLSPNNLVMWHAIRRHAADGFERMDFGRTAADNEGLRRYKTGWGAAEYTIDYVRNDLRAGEFVRRETSSSGWQTRLFQKLPDRALRLIGSVLYKHVA